METKKSGAYDTLNIVNMAVLFLFIAVGTAIYILPHFGWYVDGVRSSSMAPEIERGSMIIARAVNPASIAVNDIIIYRPVTGEENLIVHRVVEVKHNSPLWFSTKGDANPAVDTAPVPARNVKARVVYHIPVLGFLTIFLKTPVGFITAIVIPGITLALLCLQSISAELKKQAIAENATEKPGDYLNQDD